MGINLTKSTDYISKTFRLSKISDNFLTWALLVGLIVFKPWNVVIYTDKPITPTPVAVIRPNLLTAMEIEIRHGAIARSTWVDQTCYDSVTDMWMIHIPPRPELKEGYTYTVTDFTPGWFYSYNKDIKYMTLGNGSISITNMKDLFNDELFPDTAGLNCKQHKLEPTLHAK